MPDNSEYREEIEKLKKEHRGSSKFKRFKKGLRGAIKGMGRKALFTLIVALLIMLFLGFWAIKIFGVIGAVVLILAIVILSRTGRNVIWDPVWSDDPDNVWYDSHSKG